jgi:cobalt-zinc-cadmium efflux system membrane fusion protein
MTNGSITFDANRVSVISSRAEGRVLSVRADLGQAVGAGAVLATVQSAEVGATRGDLERARVGVDVARRNYEREQRLFAEQITPQKEMLEAEAAFRTAQADYNSAVSKLGAIGATDGSGATFGLVTPVSGTIVDRNASPGQVVGPTTNLFTVADLRHVWITVDVYEKDLARVHQGAHASVVPSALSSESFPGRVTYAGGIVDSATRTFKVRVEVENAALRLRPGMFAQVRIQTPATGGASVIVVPEIAVQDLNGKPVVFVAAGGIAGATGRYVVRFVTVGPRVGDGTMVITDGLRAGERIVGKGAFQLKAELTKASFGDED